MIKDMIDKKFNMSLSLETLYKQKSFYSYLDNIAMFSPGLYIDLFTPIDKSIKRRIKSKIDKCIKE